MIFLHLADLHLGRTLAGADLIDDQKYILDEIIRIAEERHADAVLIAGDIYDRPVPREAAVELFDSFIRRLSEHGKAVFMISGNHDSDERLNFGSSLFEGGGVYICSKFDGALYCRSLTDEYGEVDVWLLPFVKASQVKHYFPEENIGSYDDAVRCVIRHAGIDESRRNIIVSHQFVTGTGGRRPEAGGSENPAVLKYGTLSALNCSDHTSVGDAGPDLTSAADKGPDLTSGTDMGTDSCQERADNVGMTDEIGYTCFDSFDYAALGHIHSPQSVGREEVRYSGSPLKYSLTEANRDKSVPLVTMGEKGDVNIELLPLKPLRDLRHMTGRMDQLLSDENKTDADDYIYATLTDEDVIENAMGIFRQHYPNTLHIDYRNSHTRQIEQADLQGGGEERSFEELASDFYSQMYGTQMSDDERTLLRQAAAEAGIIS